MSLFEQDNKDLGPREKLLQAAFTLFAENGYNGTSTRSLCKMADVNISAIPYYFNSKQGLYQSLIQEITLAIRSKINVYIENVNNEKDLSPEKAMRMLEQFVSNFLDFFLDHNMPNNYGLIISREHLYPTEAYDILYENLFKEVFGVLCKLLSVLIDKNERDPMVIILVNTIFGQIISFKLFKHTLLRYLEIEKFEKKHIEMIKEKVINQIKAIVKSAGGA